MPEQSGDSFDLCMFFCVYFTGKGGRNNPVVHAVYMSIGEKHDAAERNKLQFSSCFFQCFVVKYV